MKKIKLNGASTKYAQVDDKDYDRVKGFKWYESHGYAVTTYHKKGHGRHTKGRNVNIAMHRLIMGNRPEGKDTIDHKDRNRLHNQRSNMRWATYAENSINSIPKTGTVKGVHKDCNLYHVKIGTNIVLGSYRTEKEAAMVYDKAARSLYGEFAYLNYPDEVYTKPVPNIDFIPVKRIPKSTYIGVSYITGPQKRVKRWRAIYRKKQIGTYHTEQEAHIAYIGAKYASN